MVKSKFKPSAAELLDRLTIDQLKMLKDPAHAKIYGAEIKKIQHSLAALLKTNKILSHSILLRHIIALAQINLSIWENREIMQAYPKKRSACLKLTHQLNGIRNQIKNRLVRFMDKNPKLGLRSNTSTDDLTGWHYSILKIKI